ncbi:class I SAM-dependent methyltransferase [Streptomyces sp. NPDC002519]
MRGRCVLDAGCGPGLYLAELVARGAKATGFDQSADMVRHARARLGAGVDMRQRDLDDPLDWLGDEAVDLVLAALVIHYVRDCVAALRELHRVLRPDGCLVLSTSHPTADWLADGGSYFDACHVEETRPGPAGCCTATGASPSNTGSQRSPRQASSSNVSWNTDPPRQWPNTTPVSTPNCPASPASSPSGSPRTPCPIHPRPDGTTPG